jgi:hypothetical protein
MPVPPELDDEHWRSPGHEVSAAPRRLQPGDQKTPTEIMEMIWK